MTLSNDSHLQRVFIATLTFISLLVEGWFGDTLMMLAVLFWLWLPELQQICRSCWIRCKENVFWLMH